MAAVERGQGNSRGSAKKSAARLAAVQALYQIEQSSASPDLVLEEFLHFRLGESFDTANDIAPHKALFSEIVLGVTESGGQIDKMANAALSKKWVLNRLEIILRAILRAGIYELETRLDTPSRVIITEYVDVAHAFYDGQEPGMINGMLDRVARSIRPKEFGDRSCDR